MRGLRLILVSCLLSLVILFTPAFSYAVKVNVQSYGALGDGITCDADAIQRAVNGLPPGGGTVLFPEAKAYYRIGPSKFIKIKSNTHLLGLGNRPLIFNDTSSENPGAAHPVLFCNGNIAKHKVNITIENLTVRNGDAEAGKTIRDRGGIRADYVDGLTINNCAIIRIQGVSGIELRSSRKVVLTNNYFHKCSYAATHVLNECRDLRIEGNTFDTALAHPSKNSYLFCQGYVSGWPASFQVKNVEIINNKFINSPQWSGITFHGGSNIHIANNKFINTAMACDINNVPGGMADKEMKHIVIEGNFIDISKEFKNRQAMVISGHISAKEYYPVKDVNILSNRISGGNIGIYASSIEGMVIKNNNISHSYLAGILLKGLVQQVQIDANHIADVQCLKLGEKYGASFGIFLKEGVYHTVVSNNIIDYSQKNKYLATQYGIAFRSEKYPQVQVQLSNNNIRPWFRKYIYEKFAPVEKLEMPTGVLAQRGDIALGPKDLPAYICDNPITGIILGSSKTPLGIRIRGHKGDAFVDIIQGDFRRLPSSCGITIEGAGDGGADLSTNVTGVTRRRIYLANALGSNVTSGRVLYRDAVWRKLGGRSSLN